MGKVGSGKAIGSFNTTNEKLAYAKARADRLDYTRSKFLGKVFDWWLQNGAPPVDENDRRRSPLPVPVGLVEQDVVEFPHRIEHGVNEDRTPYKAR